MTGPKSGARCSVFTGAEAGTVWNHIFKKHMTENKSCIGEEKALKQMQETDALLTSYYNYYGSKPCNVKILWKNPALLHESMALAKGI